MRDEPKYLIQTDSYFYLKEKKSIIEVWAFLFLQIDLNHVGLPQDKKKKKDSVLRNLILISQFVYLRGGNLFFCNGDK